MKRTMQSILVAEAENFLDECLDAFATFNGGIIAECYLEHSLAVVSTVSTTLLTTREDIGRYFQSLPGQYHASGRRDKRPCK